MGKVLIIDDDEMMSKAMSGVMASAGHDVIYAVTISEGLEQARKKDFDVVFLDVHMPDGSGLDALIKLRESPARPEVIIMTATGDPDGAEFAIRCGAWDYVEKKSSIKEMLLPLARAFEYRKEKLTKKRPAVLKRGKIVGQSPQLLACLDLVAQASACEANILITGETGTGKELFAKAIHENSARCSGNFVVVDCTALPANLVESVLFGHKKGSFTGAEREQEGLIAQAHGGTLFLDEIGELPLDLQVKFLRVLQERVFRPVGGNQECRSNFRLVAATNRSLDDMVDKGAFRQDLLFRLRALCIELPPLRERPEDVIEIAHYYVARLCDRYQLVSKGFSPDFLEALQSYQWPGNVRELVNTMDGAVALAGDNAMLFCKHLPVQMRVRMLREAIEKKTSKAVPLSEINASNGELPKLKDLRESLEREYLCRLLTRTRQDMTEAAQISGVSKSRLYELLKKHEISINGSSLMSME